jgi:hypothetical protein
VIFRRVRPDDQYAVGVPNVDPMVSHGPPTECLSQTGDG